MDVNDFLSRLDNVRKSGEGWTARCPAHDDRHNSLTVAVGQGGRILVHCHAGCSAERITAAMGLTVKDLFIDATPRATGPAAVEAVYTYPTGARKVRRADKSFYWQRPDGHGGFVNGRGDLPRSLYVTGKAEGKVYVCEGEKDADNVHRLGLNAVSGEDGAGPGKWRAEYTKQLQQCSACLVFQDNDPPGMAYAQETAAAIYAAGVPVKLLDLRDIWPELPEHGDISDVIEHLGPEKAAAALESLEAHMQPWTPPAGGLVSGAFYKPKDFSDAGNAAAFAAWVQAPGNERHRLLHCPALGWLHWTGAVWEIADHAALAAVEQYTQEMLDDAAQALAAASRRDEIKKSDREYLKFALSSRRKYAISAILKLAEPYLHKDLAAFDADPEKLNCPGGLVDLRTGKMQPHDPAQLCTHICSVDPADDPAGRTLWRSFLDQITQNDADGTGGPLVYYLQQISGMAAVGKVLTEKAVFLIGNGRNGKSTWVNALAAVFGTYAATMPVEVLTTARQQRGAVYAELQGKRLVQTGELEQGARLSASALKQLCSTDRIPCEKKYCAPGEFTPSHTLILCSNYLPRVGSDDAGCWRRIAVVPFNAEFGGQGEVKNFAAYLVEHAGGAILQWAIDGAGQFLQHGGTLYAPDIVQASTEDYRAREDWLSNFLDACCERDSMGRTSPATLYMAYKSWAIASGDYVRRIQDFTTGMKQRGFCQLRIHGDRYWSGVSLSSDSIYNNFT